MSLVSGARVVRVFVGAGLTFAGAISRAIKGSGESGFTSGTYDRRTGYVVLS